MNRLPKKVTKYLEEASMKATLAKVTSELMRVEEIIKTLSEDEQKEIRKYADEFLLHGRTGDLPAIGLQLANLELAREKILLNKYD